MIIVTTGGGFEFSEIEAYMVGAIGDLEHMYPLPPNPAGVAKMKAAVNMIAQGPQPEPVPSLPAIAREVSGKTFVFEANTIVLSFNLNFDRPAEATFHLQAANEPSPRQIIVGLDGVYRPSRGGRPILARGAWKDGNTFVIDYNEGPGLASYNFRIRFQGDKALFEIPGLGTYVAKEE
jgi:hypothetical protein